MTENKALKKAIRERMSETGESYTEARRAVLAEHQAAPTTEIGADRIQRHDLSAQNDAQTVSPESTPTADQVVRFEPLADTLNTQIDSAQSLAETYARLADSVTEPLRRAAENARIAALPARQLQELADSMNEPIRRSMENLRIATDLTPQLQQLADSVTEPIRRSVENMRISILPTRQLQELVDSVNEPIRRSMENLRIATLPALQLPELAIRPHLGTPAERSN